MSKIRTGWLHGVTALALTGLLLTGASGCRVRSRTVIREDGSSRTVVHTRGPRRGRGPRHKTVVVKKRRPSRPARTTVIITNAPPPRPRIVRPPCPGPTYVWIDGRYDYRGDRYVWVSGRWSVPPRGRRAWRSGRWERRGGTYVYIKGRWN